MNHLIVNLHQDQLDGNLGGGMNYDIQGLGASTTDIVLLWNWAPEFNLQNSHKQTQNWGMFLQVENWRGRNRGILADH